MTFKEYADYDGMGLAALVTKGEVTPAEITEAAIERIERLNPALNAVVYKAYDEARAVAKGPLPDGPLKGAPFLVKDLLITVAGWPRTSGSKWCVGHVDTEDSGLMKKYRSSGVVTLGKANLSEFGVAGTTENALFGPCANPWNVEHMVGGSSGGSASAVAAGFAPLAHGGDGRGSIRIPASACGLVGMKPTRDRNIDMPDGYDFAQGYVVEHVMTRTVRDCAAMLDVTGVHEPTAPYAQPAKDRPYLEEIERSPGRLKIAWSSQTANGRPINAEVQAALEQTADLLTRLGHEVVPRDLPVDQRALWASQNAYSAANFAGGMKRMVELIGREPEDDDLEGLTWASLKGGRRSTGEAAMFDAQQLRMLAHQIMGLYVEFDVFLTPTLAAPPPKLGYLSPVLNAPRDLAKRNGEFFPFCGPANMTGQPSISLPLHMSADGLPMGMMFTGRYADEATLYRLAAQLEKECPWKDRRPGVW